jgi:LPS export ABC transporter protein LptC
MGQSAAWDRIGGTMKRLKIVILAAILLIGGVVLISLWLNLRGRGVPENRNEASKILKEDAKMRMETIQLVEDKHGRKTWELEAKSVHQYEEENVIALEGVKVTFYAKEGKSFVVTGNRGKFFQDSRNMELVGDVMLESNEGYRLKTHSVSYDHAQKKVVSSDPVEIEGDLFHLTGKGMLVDMEAKSFKILNQVKTQWKRGGKG